MTTHKVLKPRYIQLRRPATGLSEYKMSRWSDPALLELIDVVHGGLEMHYGFTSRYMQDMRAASV